MTKKKKKKEEKKKKKVKNEVEYNIVHTSSGGFVLRSGIDFFRNLGVSEVNVYTCSDDIYILV